MQTADEAFLAELRQAFQTEAEEHLHVLSSGLLALEDANASDADERTEEVFRAAHSLKGAARAVGLTEIEAVCQTMESVFSRLKRGDLELTSGGFDALHKAVNAIQGLIGGTADARAASASVSLLRAVLETRSNAKGGGDAGTALRLDIRGPRGGDVTEHGTSAEEAIRGEIPSPAPAPQPSGSAATPPGQVLPEAGGSASVDLPPQGGAPVPERSARKSLFGDTIRIPTAKLDSFLLVAEQMLSAKLTTEQRAADIRELLVALSQWRRHWDKVSDKIRGLRGLADAGDAVRVGGDLAALLEFAEWSREHYEKLEEDMGGFLRVLKADHRAVSGIVNDLLEEAKHVLMLPFATLVATFPKMVRDISRDLGKEVDVFIDGADVEVDKRILEQMKDPLVHLLRNAIDHGIESPDEREARGRPRRGTVAITASQVSGNKVEIAVSDDGNGIDVEKLVEASVREGIITKSDSEELDDDAKLALMFRSGLSTSPIVTDLSGRGLGMAIVQERADELGGRVTIETAPGEGTTFRVLLPLTLATFRAVIVGAGGYSFAVPTAAVDRVTRTARDDVRTVEGREVIVLGGETVALLRLADVLGMPEAEGARGAGETLAVLVVSAGGSRVAFGVDAVASEQEVLVKDLGKQLIRVRNIAGATILGTGEIVPVLNAVDLVRSAVRATPASTAGRTDQEPGSERHSLLVVEDSITSRMLLKNVLESAGYDVTTAVDGVEGLTELKSGNFDLVVSDVEMPRRNGFELTAMIRSDGRLGDIPVILVTALESREDRERGIEVGANAYIVKSSFDQTNLLAVIQKLL